MSDSYHLLLVEDEPVTRRRMAEYFRSENFVVSEAVNGADMRRMLTDRRVDLVLLDINLPGEDGLSLARTLRVTDEVAIIMVTGRDEDIDRIVGLEVGADDYVTKPFHPRELLARVKNVLRRTHDNVGPADSEVGQCWFDDWCLSFDEHHLKNPAGEVVNLTRAEYELLSILVTSPGRILSRDRLMPRVAHRDWQPKDRTIDVLVRRLRAKLQPTEQSPELIRTVHGEGYQFVGKIIDSPIVEED
jgi:two-component system, OmpR family, torCAD operon response regulator TorR